jgi:hypothetical protein
VDPFAHGYCILSVGFKSSTSGHPAAAAAAGWPYVSCTALQVIDACASSSQHARLTRVVGRAQGVQIAVDALRRGEKTNGGVIDGAGACAYRLPGYGSAGGPKQLHFCQVDIRRGAGVRGPEDRRAPAAAAAAYRGTRSGSGRMDRHACSSGPRQRKSAAARLSAAARAPSRPLNRLGGPWRRALSAWQLHKFATRRAAPPRAARRKRPSCSGAGGSWPGAGVRWAARMPLC